MSDDLISVMTAAVEDATAPDAGGDEGGGSETSQPQASGPEATPTPETQEASTDAADASTTPEAANSATPDALDQLLAEAGITFPPAQPGQREPRIPQHRFKKLAEKVRTTLQAKHEAELKAQTDKLTQAEARAERAKLLDDLDHLSSTNPEAFIRLLANANPAYQRFLQSAATDAPAATPAPAADDPMPAPNAKYADGTEGYDNDGLKALLAWQSRQVMREANAAFRAELQKRDQALRPIIDERRQRALVAQERPRVEARIQAVRQIWGDAFDKHVAEIETAVKANRAVPFEQVVASVLVPKQRADRTAMREELLKELNQRPAASTAPAAGTKTPPAQPTSTEDVIRQALATQNLL